MNAAPYPFFPVGLGTRPEAVGYIVVREEEGEPVFPPFIPRRKQEPHCFYTFPNDFFVMTLPYSEQEPRVLTKEEKRNAFLKLLLTVMAIDAVAIAIYLILVLELGWDETVPLILLIVVTVITGFYFQWQNNKITNK
jgi:hypothetical protein